jgi:potassium efflux system protein
MQVFLPAPLRVILTLACLTLATIDSARAQTAPPSANAAPAAPNAPSATAPETPIALADIVTQAQAATTKLQNDQTTLSSDQTAQGIDSGLPAIARSIDDRLAEDTSNLQGSPSVSSLQNAQAAWQSLSDNLTSSGKALSDDAKLIDALLARLAQWQTKWQATLSSAQGAKAPAEIIQNVQAILAAIDTTTKSAQSTQAQIFSVQARLGEQSARVTDGMAAVTKAEIAARNELFTRNYPYLWAVRASTGIGKSIVAQESVSLHGQLETLKTYLEDKVPAMIIQIVLLALLSIGLFWLRKTTQSEAEKQVALQHAARIFDMPLASAFLITLLASLWLYPLAPRLLWAAVGAITLIPAIIITRRLIAPQLYVILYATVIAYLVDQVRYVLMPAGLLSRFLFLFELLAVCFFLLSILRSGYLCTARPESDRRQRLTRLYFHVAFAVLIFAGFASVFGYVHLGYLVGNGMLESSYLAVIFYAALRIADALLIAALSIPPLSGLGMVRRHHELLYDNASALFRWLFFILWVVCALQIFTVRDPLWQGGARLMATVHHWGSMQFQLGPILAFPITVWAAFLLSRFIRFALQEEVYPHLQLGRGIPYAASTMVHYTVLVLGFFAALDAMGVDLSKFSILVGAFGVGLGFGLQNIMNNFVSGMILLFERPIKVGDQVQTDPTNPATLGTVQSIGIRASVIRLTNGCELIVPNGNLIANPVMNWTLYNAERLIEIPVNITSKVDPQHVQELLDKTVAANPAVLKNPAPQVLLSTFGTTMAYRVRVWVRADDEWMKITSDLALVINSALAQENIAMS